MLAPTTAADFIRSLIDKFKHREIDDLGFQKKALHRVSKRDKLISFSVFRTYDSCDGVLEKGPALELAFPEAPTSQREENNICIQIPVIGVVVARTADGHLCPPDEGI